MADLSKLKRNSTLGSPPSLDEASSNLQSPEVAPLAKVPTAAVAQPATPPALPVVARAVPAQRLDGRTLRRSGRTLTFATKVTPEFDARLRETAQRDGLLFVEVLERALEAYEKNRARTGERAGR
jgi:hypothetical protein